MCGLISEWHRPFFRRPKGAGMSKSNQLRLDDVRAALRLVGECRDLRHDPTLWRNRACEGLIWLLGARIVSGLEARWRRPSGPIAPFHVLQSGLTPHEHDRYFTPFFARATPDDDDVLFSPLKATTERHIVQVRKATISDDDWYRCRTYDEYFRCVGTDACVVSLWELPGDRVDMFGLHRDRADRDFTSREINLLRLFHSELGALIGPLLVAADDRFSPTRLPPRVRETLVCLLEGDSEKQVAARLGISGPTVHQYVTILYRHYGVATRAELLARVLRPPGLRGLRWNELPDQDSILDQTG